MKDFIAKIISGEKKYISRAISIVENGTDERDSLLEELYKHTGKAYRIGITGPPGAGKSTITNCLVKRLQSKGYKIGVIAVDPTSPFTGGALLGDRIRMSEVSLLEGVFIRSMATRGSLGGLSKNVVEACDILDASGKDFIIIETVGVGQSELDIAETADTTIVVLVPESGDSVQQLKAGLMEIADIFLLNKSDRLGADGIAASLKNIIHLKPPSEDKWEINVLKTIADKGKGVEEVIKEIMKHKEHLEKTGYFDKKRKEHIKKKIVELVNSKLQIHFWSEEKKQVLEAHIEKIYGKTENPYSFSKRIIGT